MAIHVRSSGIAYAVFSGPLQLIDWGLIRHSRFASFSPVRPNLERLLDFYQPYRIILNDEQSERAPLSYRTKRLIRQISDIANQYNVLTHPYSLRRVKVAFGGISRDTKYERAKRITEWYPVLASWLPPERDIWKRESSRLGVFDAISLAIAFFHHDYEDLPHDQQTIYA